MNEQIQAQSPASSGSTAAATSAAVTPNASTPNASTSGASTPGASTPGASTPGASTPGASTPGVSTSGNAPANAGSVDLAAVKSRQHAAWSSGDFAIIGVTLQIVGESLAEAVDIRAGEAVIDIAAGNGNATLAAARRFARVVSTDYVPALLEKGRLRAAADGLTVEFQEADAEHLPFADGSFDVALSTFGAMFAPDHARTAAEMLRVVRAGGRIGMANWTPDGFVGQLFKTVGKHVPPPPGILPAPLWGTEQHVRQLFGGAPTDLRCLRKSFNFRYASSAHMLQVFRDFYGPVHKAFAALPPAGAAALERDIIDLLERCNVAGRESLVIPGEYLEVVISKPAAGLLH